MMRVALLTLSLTLSFAAALRNPTVSVSNSAPIADDFVAADESLSAGGSIGGREDRAERWEVMPLEAEPVLPTIPRTHGSEEETTNRVMRFDFSHRLQEGEKVHPQLSSIAKLCSPEYSISFWLDVNNDSGSAWRTIFYKGATKGERAPAMFLHPVTKRIQFHQAVGTEKNPEMAVVSSKSGIPLFTPVHVAVVRRLGSVEIYINGVKDASAAAPLPNLCNIGPLHINPAAFGLKQFTGRLRNFKWYDVAVSPGDVKRLNFEGVENTVVHLNYRKHYSGASADGDVIPADDVLNSKDWSIATWIMLTELPLGVPQRVFQKGDDGFAHAPSLTIIPGENKLSLRLNTKLYRSEGMLSPEPLRVGQPTHVGCIKEGNVLRMYIDGTLAKEIRLSSPMQYNDGPLYIARSSSTSAHNGMAGFLENFRWYDRALTGAEIREVTAATAPGPVASFGTDRSPRISAVTFPDTPKLRTSEFTVEFWLRNLSKKVRSSADNLDKDSLRDVNDQEADAQDDDRARSEEEVIADETAPISVVEVDPEVAELTKREADEEEDLDEAVETVENKRAGLGKAPSLAAARAAEARRLLSDAYDEESEARFRAYDAEHMGDFDDDVSMDSDNEGFEGFEDGARWGGDEIEKQENSDVVAEIQRQRKLRVAQKDMAEGAKGDEGGDDDAPLDSGYRGVTGPAARRASVIANNEDKVTGYGDEDSGRVDRDELLRDGRIRDPARAVPRSDEDGTHLYDDDMSPAQRPDEDGEHEGDVIDDNQIKVKGDRNGQDGDIDPYLYGRSGSGKAKLNPIRKQRLFDLKADTQGEKARKIDEGLEAKAMRAASSAERLAAERAAARRAAGVDGSVPTEILLSSVDDGAPGHGDAYASIEDLDAAVDADARKATLISTEAGDEPLNPLTREMSPKERAATILPVPKKKVTADSDDLPSGDKRRDYVTDEDGEEAIDEPASEGAGEETTEESTGAGDGDAAAAAASASSGRKARATQKGQHLEPDADDEAERAVTGTSNVPGRDGGREFEEHDDKDDDEDDTDLESESESDDESAEDIARREEDEEGEEDEGAHEEDEEPPRGTGSGGARMYDESYIGGRVGTPGRRPARTSAGTPPKPEREDVEETAEARDEEGDYNTGVAPRMLSLFRKGGRYDEFTPSLHLDTRSLKLRARVSTRGHRNETIVSRRALYGTKPNHVAMTVNGRVMRLYVNGVLDSEKVLKRRVKSNRGPLRIARELRRHGINAHVSGVKVHPRALRRDEVRQVQYSVSLPLRSYYNELVGDHLYSSRPVMKGVQGYRYLGIKGWVQSHPVPGSVPLYRFYNPAAGDHRYSIESLTGEDAEGYFYSGIVGYVYTQYRKNTAALIEYQNPLVGDHFYTTDPSEVQDSFFEGYERVGTVCYVEVNRVSAVPAYRLYDRSHRPRPAISANYRGEVNGRKRVRLLSSELEAQSPFTVAAWINVFDDATGEPRVVFRKGNATGAQTPSMYLNPTNRKAEVRVTTTKGVERVESKTDIAVKANTHVAVVFDGEHLALVINGRVDAYAKLEGKLVHNSNPLTFGASDTPDKDGIGFRGRVRDIRWFQRAITAAELERIVSVTSDRPALTLSYAPQFDEETEIRVPHQNAFNAKEYTLFMTVEPTNDCEDNFCAILSKAGQPTVGVNARGQLSVSVASANGTTTVTSKEALELKTAVSVAIVYQDEFVFLYLDGDLDSGAQLKGPAAFNTRAVTLGKAGKVPGFSGYVTEIAWYRRAFAQAEIVARADHRSPPTIVGFERKDLVTPGTSVVFPHRRQLNTVGASVTMWLKLLHHADHTTALVTKGEKATKANPAVLLRKDGRILVLVETGVALQAAVSESKIPLNFPTHVAVVRAGRTIKIFINGKLDAMHVSGHAFSFNTEPLTIGKIGDVPATLGWLRNVQWHDYSMERDHVDRTLRDTML